MIGVFIDGPLAGEVRSLPDAPPTWRVPLPPRVTFCNCDPGKLPIEARKPAEIFEYHRIAHGPKVAIYSKEQDDNAILRELKEWVTTDLKSPMLLRHCRDKRAFS